MRLSIERATLVDGELSVEARIRGKEICRVYMVYGKEYRFECTCENRELCKEAEARLKKMYGME